MMRTLAGRLLPCCGASPTCKAHVSTMKTLSLLVAITIVAFVHQCFRNDAWIASIVGTETSRRLGSSDAKVTLSLTDASNQKVTDLTNGVQVTMSNKTTWNIQATVVVPNVTVQSVVLRHSTGGRTRRSVSNRSSWSPFLLCHNRRGAAWRRQCLSMLNQVGDHTISVTAYDRRMGLGKAVASATVSFTVSSPTKCSIPKFVGDWEWRNPSYPLTVAEAQGAMIGPDLVVISGFHNGYDQSTAHTYALDVRNTSATWRRRDDVPVAAGITHGAFAVGGYRLYMCGGYVGGHPGLDTNQCFVYDHAQPTGKQWSTLASLPIGRAGGGLVFDTQRRALVFAAGARRPVAGNAEAFDYNSTWMYQLDNPKAGWVTKANIPFMANHMSFVTAMDPTTQQERHFFLGGQVGENEYTGNVADHFEWDMANEVWIRRASMPTTRGHAASSTRALGCGFLIAAGSTNEAKGKTADVSYYDLPTDTWTSMGSLPNAINTPVCDVHSGYLYCESGWPTGSFSYRRRLVA